MHLTILGSLFVLNAFSLKGRKEIRQIYFIFSRAFFRTSKQNIDQETNSGQLNSAQLNCENLLP